MSLLDTSDTVWDELDAQIREQAVRDAIHRCMKRITYKDMYKELPDPSDHEPGSVIGLSRKDLYGLFFFYIFIYNIKLKKHDISFI